MDPNYPPRRKSADTSSNFTNRSLFSRSLMKPRQRSSGDTSELFKGPFGLTTLFEPLVPAVVDLIFVHGLAGGSQSTWSKDGDPSLFWPKEWLPQDSAFQDVRIHSFGYDSNWDKESALNVHDFAKSFLGSVQDCPTIPLGSETPIVLVGHSMGGLVMKRALILARQINEFDSIAKRVRAMFFLATPHRGADMAALLSKILLVVSGNRPFVDDLRRNSLATQSINDEFPQHCKDVQLYSFYETLPTNYGVGKGIVVEKDLATLGYHNERATYLNANHRGICKYSTPDDNNYITVRNALSKTIEGLRGASVDHTEPFVPTVTRVPDAEQRRFLEQSLQISDASDEDIMDVDSRRMRGSCEWLTEKKSFQAWRDSSAQQMYWISGKPGAGKSILSGYIVNHLETLGHDCVFYFFKYGDKPKSSVSYFLRTIAYEMSLAHPEVLDMIVEICNKDTQICKSDFRIIWRKLFLDGILKITLEKPQYWIIDALDECKADTDVVPLLLKATEMSLIRILVTSRNRFESYKPTIHRKINVHSEEISVEDTKADILLYLQANLDHIPSVDENDASRYTMVNKLVEKSQGSFLWVNLVLNELQQVSTSGEIRQVLADVPSDMDDLYSRILEMMSRAPYGKELAKAILTWTVYAARPLTVPELGRALEIDMKDNIHNLQKYIRSSCGQLVYVDNQNPGRVHMVHQTAREFLLRKSNHSYYAVDNKEGHKRLAMACLEYLSGPEMKSPRRRRLIHSASDSLKERSPFANYACISFYEHIHHITSVDDDFLTALVNFLKSTNVLCWIEYIAENSELNRLIFVSKALRDYLQRRSKHISPFGKEMAVVDSWATDLGRLMAKFGKNLKASPSSIYHLIPPFCPVESAPRKQFTSATRGIAVLGISASSWDDCLSTITYQREEVSALTCSSLHFAIGLSSGRVIIYNEMTYQEVRSLQHKERVSNIQFGSKGQLLASSGQSKIRVWDTFTWQERWEFDTGHKCMTLLFLDDDKMLIGALKNNHLSVWDLTVGCLRESIDWTQDLEGQRAAYFRRPTDAAFRVDSEQRQLAVVYRGQDILLWDVERDALNGTLSRKSTSGERIPGMIVTAVAFSSSVSDARLAASYWDGNLVLYDTTDGSTVATTRANAQKLASSPDGRTLAAGDTSGTISIFDFETLKLLYRVSAEENAIKGLAFTGDGERLIDIRGSQCRVWDPMVLIRHDADEEVSDTVSISTTAQELSLDAPEDIILITALACPKHLDIFFCGKDNGAVTIYDAKTGKAMRELLNLGDGVSVLSVLFDELTHILTCSDSSSRVLSYQLKFKEREWHTAETRFDHAFGEAVEQVLENKEHTLLLIGSANTDTLYSIIPKGHKVLKTLPWSNRGPHRWASHPVHHNQLMLVQDNIVRLFNWQTLDELTGPEGIRLVGGMLPNLFIRAVTPCFNSSVLATVFAEKRTDRAKSHLLLFQTSDFGASSAMAAPILAYEYISDLVDFLLGAHHSRLLFLHSNGWVCSTVPETSNRNYVRHFFIPPDWLCTTTELLIALRGNGDIVFVKRDEVAIIKRGLDTREPEHFETPGLRQPLGLVREDPY